MKRIRSYIIDYFGFSKTEANASIILVLVVIFTAIVPRLYIKHLYAGSELDFGSKEELKAWHEEFSEAFVEKNPKQETIENDLFTFDPNEASLDDLISLGFKPYIAERIKKYHSAGGRFHSSEDLKKIYGIDKSLVDKLQSYITINPVTSNHFESQASVPDTPQENRSLVKENLAPFDLNSAGKDDLEKLRGIGPYFANRIIKYREALGGFSSMDQIEEVYGIKQDIIDVLKKSSEIQSKTRRTIYINTDSIKTLSKHPYLSWNHARAIVNYRKQHGQYKSEIEIKEIKIISDSLYQKISPYLSIEPPSLNASSTPILPPKANEPIRKQ